MVSKINRQKGFEPATRGKTGTIAACLQDQSGVPGKIYW